MKRIGWQAVVTQHSRTATWLNKSQTNRMGTGISIIIDGTTWPGHHSGPPERNRIGTVGKALAEIIIRSTGLIIQFAARSN